MATRADLELQLGALMLSLEKEGVVDDCFSYIREIKGVHHPSFFHDLVSEYSSNTREKVEEMARMLKEADVDFTELELLATKMKTASSSVGSIHMTSATEELRRNSAAKDKDRCIVAFDGVLTALDEFDAKVKPVLEFEKKIIELEYL